MGDMIEMGLSLADGVGDFFYEGMTSDFNGKNLLMLGYQYIIHTSVQIVHMADRIGFDLHEEELNDINGHIEARSFFKALGFSDVYAMDISDYEGADIIFDLNSSVLPDELHNKFDYIVDGGTLEHVFNIPNALGNIMNMLKQDGKVYHYVPGAAWINHGFYTFSPLLFSDFYMANGFKVIRSDMILYHRDDFSNTVYNRELPTSLEEVMRVGIDTRLIDRHDGMNFDSHPNYQVNVRCIAKKTSKTGMCCSGGGGNVPIQKYWYDHEELANYLVRGLGLKKYRKGEIAIYGIGHTANRLMKCLRAVSFSDEIIAGFLVTETDKKDFCGFPIIDCNNLKASNIKVIIIAAFDFEEEIYRSIQELQQQGIRIIKLSPYSRYM